MKRILSWLLALAMVMTLTPAFAYSNPQKDTSVTAAEIESALVSLQIAKEGVVLLENNNGALPYAKSGDVAGCKEFTLKTMRKYMHFFNEPTKEGLPTPWLAIIKEGLTMRGVDIGVPRKPIQPLPDSVRDELRATLREMGHYVRG